MQTKLSDFGYLLPEIDCIEDFEDRSIFDYVLPKDKIEEREDKVVEVYRKYVFDELEEL